MNKEELENRIFDLECSLISNHKRILELSMENLRLKEKLNIIKVEEKEKRKQMAKDLIIFLTK